MGNGGGDGGGFGERVSLLLRLLFVLAWTVLLLALFAVAWSARNSDDIVIERIEAPPQWVGGLKDEALARRILHELTVMRVQTADPVRVEGFSVSGTSWLRDFRVEVPQTGLSIADLYIAFRRWFGRDIHVRGSVYRVPGSAEPIMSLWVRDEASVHKLHGDRPLEAQIAEHIYAKSYPARHAFWVSGDSKRVKESIRFLQRIAFNDRRHRERALALYSLAIIEMEDEGKCEQAAELFLRAKVVDPELPTVLSNLSNAYHCLGRDQEAADATHEELTFLSRGGGEVDRRRRRGLALENKILLAGARGHHLERVRLYERMELEGYGFKRSQRAINDAENKDFAGSLGQLKAHLPGAENNSGSAWLCYKYFEAREDWPQALTHIAAVASANAARRSAYIDRQLTTQILPLAAIALARTGKFAHADIVLDAMPARNCYLCARSRAAVAEERRREAAVRGSAREAARFAEDSDKHYAEAVALAPRLPFAHLEWGRAKLSRKDTEGAIALFATAGRLGPRWSEPAKYRADALVRMGDFGGAAVFYSRAAKLAPRWFALHHGWSIALARLGRSERAAEIAAESAGMKVAPAEMAWLRDTCKARSDELRKSSREALQARRSGASA